MKSSIRMMLPLLASLLLLGGCDLFSSKTVTPTGTLFIESKPEGAIVEADGKALGTTPLQATDVPSGKILLTVRKEGYETARSTVELVTGDRVVREFELVPVRGLVLVRSNPPGAAVELDGAFVGNTPLPLYRISPGDHHAKLSLQGYDSREVDFTVSGRIPRAVDVDMISNSGSLVVDSSPPGATVYVDGRDEGPAPVSLPRVQKGSRDILLQLQGHEPYRAQVVINPGDTSRLQARLTPLPGVLKVVTLPGGGRIYVDDEYRGDSPLTVDPMPPGVYVVRAEVRGHAAESRTVTVNKGDTTIEEFQLVRNSGILEIITRPADVKVYVDSELVGTTRARGSDVVSEPLQIDLLSQGSHTLQLVRKGYVFETKRFFITKDQVTTLEETLRRQFIPNTLVRTGAGQDNAVTGVLVRKHLNGDIELEVSEGIFRTIPARDVVSVEPLKQEERIEPTPTPAAPGM